MNFEYGKENVVSATGGQQLVIGTQKLKSDRKYGFTIEKIAVYKDGKLTESESPKPSFLDGNLYIQAPSDTVEYIYELVLTYKDKGTASYGFVVRVDMLTYDLDEISKYDIAFTFQRALFEENYGDRIGFNLRAVSWTGGNQMNNFVIEESTREGCEVVDNGIVEYNSSKVPFTQEPSFSPINRIIKGLDGDTIAGINSILYCWNCLYIDVLWVKEDLRKHGYGSALLNEVEKVAKEKGCKLIHLDTFDFQAKDFYLKHGYEVFGVLDDCPSEHKRYYMKKNI